MTKCDECKKEADPLYHRSGDMLWVCAECIWKSDLAAINRNVQVCSCGSTKLMRVLLCDDCGAIIMPMENMYPYTIWFPANPCQNGHVFIWTSSNPTDEPPEGTPCRCGETFYHKNEHIGEYQC